MRTAMMPRTTRAAMITSAAPVMSGLRFRREDDPRSLSAARRPKLAAVLDRDLVLRHLASVGGRIHPSWPRHRLGGIGQAQDAPAVDGGLADDSRPAGLDRR